MLYVGIQHVPTSRKGDLQYTYLKIASDVYQYTYCRLKAPVNHVTVSHVICGVL